MKALYLITEQVHGGSILPLSSVHPRKHSYPYLYILVNKVKKCIQEIFISTILRLCTDRKYTGYKSYSSCRDVYKIYING